MKAVRRTWTTIGMILTPSLTSGIGLARHVEDGRENLRERCQDREPVHAIFLVATMRP